MALYLLLGRIYDDKDVQERIVRRIGISAKYTSRQRVKVRAETKNVATRYFTAVFRYNASKNS